MNAGKPNEDIKSFSWEYDGEQPQNYIKFIQSRIKITWGEYPDIKKLKEEKKKDREKTLKNKTIK